MEHNEQRQPPILDECEAAQLLRVSIRTLQQWRVNGRGPEFIKLGRSVRYQRETLTKWIASQTRASTAAHTVAQADGE